MAGLGLVQSLAVIAHCLLLLPGALVTAAVVLGVPVTKSGIPANTIFSLLGTNVATPEPALFLGTLGWVAAGVACTVSLDPMCSVRTCPIAGLVFVDAVAPTLVGDITTSVCLSSGAGSCLLVICGGS